MRVWDAGAAPTALDRVRKPEWQSKRRGCEGRAIAGRTFSGKKKKKRCTEPGISLASAFEAPTFRHGFTMAKHALPACAVGK